MMDDSTDSTQQEAGLAPIAIHPSMLRPATFPPFDLYVRGESEGELALFRKADEPVYANIYNKVQRGGFEVLYARGEDREPCFDYVEANLPGILEQGSLPPQVAAEWVYRLACRAMEALISDPDSFRDYRRVEALVGAIASTIRRHPGAEWHMTDCAPMTYSTHAHCVNVCALLVSFAGRVLGVADEDLITEVAIGAIMHDVGKAMVPTEILTKPAGLSRREFAQVKKHPRYGLKIVQPYLRQAATARCIIGQHHENACGGGYPEGRSGQAINVFARAARMVDVFDALTTDRPYGAALDNYGALNTMVSEMRGQFDMPMLRKFIRHLGSELEGDTSVTVREVPEPAQEEPPEQVGAEAPAEAPEEETETMSAGVEMVPIIRLEPVHGAGETRAEAAGPASTASGPQVTMEATLQERLDVIRDLGQRRDNDTSLMTGVVGALKDALSGPLRGALPTEGAQGALARPGPTAQTEPELARGLFPLVWQIDEWRARFATGPEQTPEATRLQAETLACLRTLREEVVRALLAHNVEIIEDARAPDSAMHEQAERPAAGRVTRVGFLYTGGASPQVLEPARTVLYADQRRAG